uniref:wall-associated receptor kinase 3-like n=1 Tax=Fragaria vesca subsp. vesca TaxID=101020 RepID=UPI0005CAC300|nr:PREDICTED: wall-associated receptor kinase 3-like [Fragaria vesca subsp. vesca]
MSEMRDRRPSTSDARQPDLDLTLLFGSTVSAGGESERVCVLSRSEERRRKRSGQRCVGDQFGGDEGRLEGSSLPRRWCGASPRKRLIKLKRRFFEQNGGILLQQHLNLSRHKPAIEVIKIYSSEELKKATNYYDNSNILGQGANGTVYKGVFRSNKIVAIKRSKTCDRSQIGEFINKGIVLSQVNHRNVVKLLGCCLETEVPVLVYEFITNGTLGSHLHANRSLNQSLPITLKLQMRLKIAAEIAGALAYLHSETCMPIIHRDVKTSNILLDDNFTAKVADFGASRLIPLGQTQLTTLLQGTIGYLDPEFLYSSELTDKSDVYSFGVILAELLTGKTPLIFDEGRKSTVNLAVYFVSCVEEECLHKILDDQVAMEDEVFEVVKQVAGVAVMYVFKDKKGGTTYHEGSCSRARSFVQNVILLIKNIT